MKIIQINFCIISFYNNNNNNWILENKKVIKYSYRRKQFSINFNELIK